MDVDVIDAPERKRYEARVGGQLAAVADYIPTEELVAFTHTEVLPGFEGKGVASTMISHAMDDVRASHRSVLAVCPFVSGYVQRHFDQYGDLLYQSRTRTVHD